MSRLPTSSGDRSAAYREGLLGLTRSLVGARNDGALSEALELVAESLGAEAGAAYEVDRDALVLVAHLGLSLEARAALERLPRSEEPAFIAARAAKSRRLVVEADAAGSTASAEIGQVLAALGRPCAVAVPLAAGREVLGVLVFLSRRSDAFDAGACAFLETAAGLITLARKATSAAARSSARREEAHMGSLAMAGMLAAHFADDVRGPLAAISLVMREGERVLERMQLPGADVLGLVPPFQQLIQEAERAVKRAQSVTDQIVSAAQAGPKERLLFTEVLRDAADAVAPIAEGRGVLLVRHLQGDGHVTGRRAELVPAFVAMITNAVQACEQGPRTRRATVKITAEDDPRGVSASIEDTGPGVAADIRSRIFDPFFSTNEGAAGIGLTLAKHAIVGNSGHIEIAMSPSLGGALFRVVLPRATALAKKEQRRSSLSSATLRRVNPRPTLVWIDRDDVFLAGARRALEGLDMHTASTVEQGEALVLGSHPSPEIVFCELDLPDGGGIDLHAEIARKNPDLAGRFVFVTDGVLSPERAAYIHGSGCPTLVKPLDLSYIRALVYAASGERDSPSSRRAVSRRGSFPDTDDPFDM